MRETGPASVLGVNVNGVEMDEAVERILAAAIDARPLTVSALAVHGVMTGVLDREHRWRLNNLDLVVPDGQPVRWALNLLHGAGLAERVYGPDLMLKVCEEAAARGLSIFLYGSTREVLDSLLATLGHRFPGLPIAGSMPSRFGTASESVRSGIAREIRESGASIVFVGLGCPRQEVWLYEQRDLLPMPLLAVGAAFDFHAGRMPQAPPVLQRAGLEWLYRLVREPRRLWKRYLFLNPLYLALLGLQALRLLDIDPASGRRPGRDIGYA